MILWLALGGILIGTASLASFDFSGEVPFWFSSIVYLAGLTSVLMMWLVLSIGFLVDGDFTFTGTLFPGEAQDEANLDLELQP